MTDEQPKIIIDTDWKAQAQQEKEKLSGASEAKAQGQQGAKPGPVTFLDILRSFIEPALLYLGRIPDPATGKAVISLELSRLYIDMLSVLEEKTRGNLEKEEEEALRTTLAELRADWVDLSKHVAKAVAEGKIKPSHAGAASISGPGPAGGV